jgi:hypothetical protein
MDRTDRLLRVGYLPSQLPPPFTTRMVADHYAHLKGKWSTLSNVAPLAKAELFSVARAGHQRRSTSLANPVTQTFLSVQISAFWGKFVQHYRKSRFSTSHPRFLAKGGRAANVPSMGALFEKKVLMSAGFKFMLRTDISRFFPTIYTHAVPWSLHGKAVAKKNRHRLNATYFGNLIDQALRQGQDGQTIGIPIGPDTSHIIAEAIATSLDLSLRTRLKQWPIGFRYVDDYFMFFQTMSECEEALAALARVLKDYELQLNFEKTKIASVSDISEDSWTHQLRSFKLDSVGRLQRSDIHHFFDLAKDLARKNTDENVMKYALKRAASTLVQKVNWDVFEAHLCHIVLSYPNTLQTVAQVLGTYHHHGFPLDKVRLTRLVNVLVQDHAPLGHHSEVAWALWICKDLSLRLERTNIDLVSEMHSSVCALILMDLEANTILPKPIKRTYWAQLMTADALREDLWLLSYEAGVRGWAGFNDAHVLADDYFRELQALNIRFYDVAAATPRLFDVKQGALAELQLQSPAELFDRDDATNYLEYHDEDSGYEGVNIEEFDVVGAEAVPDWLQEIADPQLPPS